MGHPQLPNLGTVDCVGNQRPGALVPGPSFEAERFDGACAAVAVVGGDQKDVLLEDCSDLWLPSPYLSFLVTGNERVGAARGTTLVVHRGACAEHVVATNDVEGEASRFLTDCACLDGAVFKRKERVF